MKTVDRVGHRYGMLVIINRLPEKINGRIAYEARCDCGNVVPIWSFTNVLDRMKKSCGCNKKSRLPEGQSNFNSLLSIYKKNARNREIDFNLGIDEFFKLVTDVCYYCGAPPSNIRSAGGIRNGVFIYSGIDRVDPDLGYESSNVVSCCSHCNTAKMCMSKDEFFEWIDNVHAHIHGQDS